MSPAVFQHGHLRLYLLSLLAERAMHGYELIQALADRFGGTYVPSAGTIYPRLAKLEEEGLVTKTVEGRKTVYAITDAGRAELAARGDDLRGIEEELTDSVRRLADEVRASVTDAMRTLRAELAASAREAREEAARAASEASTDARVLARTLLHQAEAALAEFRADVRAEFRSAAAAGLLTDDAVDRLTAGLTDLRREIVARLR